MTNVLTAKDVFLSVYDPVVAKRRGPAELNENGCLGPSRAHLLHRQGDSLDWHQNMVYGGKPSRGVFILWCFATSQYHRLTSRHHRLFHM